MYYVYSKVGKGKQEKGDGHQTFESAFNEVKHYYDNYGGDNTLYKDGARIVSNNEPILNLTIKEVK